jgi:hypothetical protein
MKYAEQIYKRNNFKDFTELQSCVCVCFIYIYIYMIFHMTWNTHMHLLVTDTFKKEKMGVWIRKPVSIWCDQYPPAAQHISFADKWHDNGPRDLVTVSLCIQIANNKIQLCSLSAYACP